MFVRDTLQAANADEKVWVIHWFCMIKGKRLKLSVYLFLRTSWGK